MRKYLFKVFSSQHSFDFKSKQDEPLRLEPFCIDRRSDEEEEEEEERRTMFSAEILIEM